MKKHILITGAAGFVGFHLAKKLRERGDEVLGYDNFNDYYTPELKRRRAAFLHKIGVQVIEGNISDKFLLESVLKQHQTTHMVHLAAQAGVRYSLENPDAYVQSNLEGFVSILEACRRHSLKLVYASSSSVYGKNTKSPFAEGDRTDHPASFYGATKKANEVLAYSYHHLYNISVTGLRFFTVYGPWGRPDMAYYSFTKALHHGHPIQLFNQGMMRRDFTYIDDIVTGTIAAIDAECGCEIFNLGGNKPESLATFVEILERHVGRKAEKLFLPMQPGDIESTCADLSHSRKVLNYLPTISLDEGLKRFVSWYKSYHEGGALD